MPLNKPKPQLSNQSKSKLEKLSWIDLREIIKIIQEIKPFREVIDEWENIKDINRLKNIKIMHGR